jgi:hypothetical protein
VTANLADLLPSGVLECLDRLSARYIAEFGHGYTATTIG